MAVAARVVVALQHRRVRAGCDAGSAIPGSAAAVTVPPPLPLPSGPPVAGRRRCPVPPVAFEPPLAPPAPGELPLLSRHRAPGSEGCAGDEQANPNTKQTGKTVCT